MAANIWIDGWENQKNTENGRRNQARNVKSVLFGEKESIKVPMLRQAPKARSSCSMRPYVVICTLLINKLMNQGNVQKHSSTLPSDIVPLSYNIVEWRTNTLWDTLTNELDEMMRVIFDRKQQWKQYKLFF